MSDTAGSRNDGSIDQLLLEAGMDDDGQLRHALVNLRTLAAEAPAPSADVAALMAGGSIHGYPTTLLPEREPGVQPADELAARRRAKRRITLTTLSVAASLAAGGAVAAASDQGFRDSFTQLNHAVTSFVTGSVAPGGNNTRQVPAPPPAAPRTSATSSADAVPPAPVSASAPAAGSPSGIPTRPGNTPSHGAGAESPVEVPVEPSLPTNAPGDVRKGLEQGSKLPVPVPTEVPLPGKAPDVPLK